MTTIMERPGETRAGYDNRRRLVVIGNGMAGARVVEEILARGGAEQFSITMFGDEPYGNYNRIMLSHVLSGEESHDDIFLNSLEWYVDNGITLHRSVRVERIDRFAKVVFSDDGQVTPYHELIIAPAAGPSCRLWMASTTPTARCCLGFFRSGPSTIPGA